MSHLGLIWHSVCTDLSSCLTVCVRELGDRRDLHMRLTRRLCLSSHDRLGQRQRNAIVRLHTSASPLLAHFIHSILQVDLFYYHSCVIAFPFKLHRRLPYGQSSSPSTLDDEDTELRSDSLVSILPSADRPSLQQLGSFVVA